MCSTDKLIGNVYVFWSGCTVASGQERINTDNVVAEAARQRGFRVAGIRCGIHDETRSSKAQYAARVPCERHITVNFAMSMGDYYYEYTSAHIYTDGTRISRVEWHARLRP